jgi:hypothetical protein
MLDVCNKYTLPPKSHLPKPNILKIPIVFGNNLFFLLKNESKQRYDFKRRIEIDNELLLYN